MDLEKRIHFREICRICLKSYKMLLDLFKPETLDMLNFCDFLKIIEGDELPDKICEQCNNMLSQSYKLKQLCLQSESYFGSLINKDISYKNEQDMVVNSVLDCEGLHNTEAEVSECLQAPEEEVFESEPLKNIAFSHTCSECQSSFSSENLFNEHTCTKLINGDDQAVLPSSECGTNDPLLQVVNDSDSISEEKVDEKINVYYICPKCNLRFDHKLDFSVHQSIHSDKDLICNVCDKLFRTMKMLKRHVKTHMISKSHVCKICGKGFSESSARIRHMKQNHLHLPREKKYSCDECGQRFTDKYYLNLHMRKHTGEKPFDCKICNKAFYDPRSYKIHMDVHDGNKTYFCNHCGKSFVQNSHLKQHLLVHTKEKPYSCDICNKSFTQSTSLQRHQKVQSGMFYCCVCVKTFTLKKEFLDHKENHLH